MIVFMIWVYKTVEPCSENPSSDTKWAVQSQKIARGVEFQIYEVEGLYYVAKTKTVISNTVTSQPNCAFFRICKNLGFSRCGIYHVEHNLMHLET